MPRGARIGGSARSGLEAAKLAPMVRTDLPDDVSESVTRAAEALGVSKRAVVLRALEQYLPTVAFLPDPVEASKYPPLPDGYHPKAARVYAALAQMGGGPVTTNELVEKLGIHRGNVDRHLDRLRSDGFVARSEHRHRIIVRTPLAGTEEAATG